MHVSVRLKPSKLQTPDGARASIQPHAHAVCERSRIWKVLNANQLKLNLTNEVFTFDRIYDEQLSTKAIFQDHCKHMIHQAIKGYNVTIFAYGQTSSGKTHTMHGDAHRISSD